MYKNNKVRTWTTLTSWAVSINGTVTFDFGLKHMTLQVPLAISVLNRGSDDSSGCGTSSSKAGKSLVKTKVDSYSGLTSPLGLVTPGHSGFFGSNSGSSSSSDFSTWPLHGLLIVRNVFT